MTRVSVTVEINDQQVKDVLWLLFDRTEFEDPDSVTQKGLERLRDYKMLEDRIMSFEAGLAHCYFTAQKDNGEDILFGYLEKMDRSEKDSIGGLNSSFNA